MADLQINLLSQDDFSHTSLGRVSSWALSIGRWIVVITELIVIAAFIARFKLDRDIANLSDEINQKQAIIKAYAPFEAKFRTTQQRLQVADQALAQQSNYDSILAEINKALPNDVVLSSIDIKDTELTIKATALTEPGMAGMQAQLQQSPLFARVGLVKVDVQQGFESGIQFEIHAQLATPEK